MALRCMATMISVRVKVMAEHAMDHLSADTDCDSSLSFTTSTTEPSVMVENTRKATHCAKRGDLVSDMISSLFPSINISAVVDGTCALG